MTQTLTTEAVDALNDKACAALDRLSREMVACARRNYLDSSFVEMRSVVAELLDALCEVANREAQPVAWTSQRSLETKCKITAFTDDMSALEYGAEKGWKYIVELFTAPPAPAVPSVTAIPEACRGAMLNHSGDSANMVNASPVMPKELVEEPGTWKTPDVVFGWNECRAAMLAQPVSPGKLPPHAYRELVNSLRDTAVKYSGTDQLRERLNTALSQFIEPDHSHTRTTAPEVSSD